MSVEQQVEFIIDQIRDNHPLLKAFDKYIDQDQRHMTDYERGITHATNAFIPVIAELVVQLATTKGKNVQAQLSEIAA